MRLVKYECEIIEVRISDLMRIRSNKLLWFRLIEPIQDLIKKDTVLCQ